jgi:hypothetical protein
MKNIIEDYNSITSMTKKPFLCVLDILSSPTMMSVAKRHVTIMVKLAVAKRHVTIMVKLAIGYETVMKKN